VEYLFSFVVSGRSWTGRSCICGFTSVATFLMPFHVASYTKELSTAFVLAFIRLFACM
jgi:hypothetical protein